ncbi:MAG: phosphatase PAP2 family protein [Phycisphaerae bacterium]|nr:phosphatase PAP2 family protein [Phycisphaerae bacterium]
MSYEVSRTSRTAQLGLVRSAVLAWVLVTGSGCLSTQGERDWGGQAGWPVHGPRVLKAARDALFDPQTWVPAACALVFAIDDWDQEVSDWATGHTPVFGSQDDAVRLSNDLLSVLEAEVPLTVLVTPSGRDPETWVMAKARGVAVEYGAIAATGLATHGLKDWTDRERPNGQDHESLPSGHASSAFAHATLSNRNLSSIPMPKGWRRTCQITNLALAGTVAWARVEGKAHYPSDVLAGAALGHFLTAFLHDAFMNLSEGSPVQVALVGLGDGAALQVVLPLPSGRR